MSDLVMLNILMQGDNLSKLIVIQSLVNVENMTYVTAKIKMHQSA